jgi:capsular polysaccharide biosynthesis protein
MMLDFMADEAEVTDADMNWLGNAIKITGETEDQVIEIEVTIKKKEEKKDA